MDKVFVKRYQERDILLAGLKTDAAGNAQFAGDGWSITLIGRMTAEITQDCFRVWEDA